MSSEQSERKASEILLDLESRIKGLESLVKLQEFQNRLILDSVNKLLNKKAAKPIDPIVPKSNIKDVPEIKEEVFQPVRGKSVPITQQVYSPSGQPLLSASVVIKNQEGKVVRRVNTNMEGRWIVALAIGKYIAKVAGKDKDDVLVEFSQEFEVIESAVPLIIPPPQEYAKK
jgi:uncharacterized protein YoxC